jgi:uncharacterized protein (DUF305 family)
MQMLKSAVAGACLCVAVGCDQRIPTSPTLMPLANATQNPRSEPAPTAAASNFEINFMTGMIDHHHMAIMMAEQCLEEDVRAELEELCADIIETQSQEIELMQTWLTDWYGVSYEPEMKPGDMKMMERLASLEGDAFAIEFMETMIRHHRKAVVEARQCVDKAFHDELESLCENIIETQAAEIALMSTWLCQWYGRCGGPGL